jgi:hypothetical protein
MMIGPRICESKARVGSPILKVREIKWEKSAPFKIM